jgi:malic enzyme
VSVTGEEEGRTARLPEAARRPKRPTAHDFWLPGMENLREISTAVAAAVYHAAVQDAVATKEHHDLVRSIFDIMWIPEYQTGEEI